MLKELFKVAINTATVTRYSNNKLMRDESVMEHTGSVAFMCFVLGSKVNELEFSKVDMEVLLARAIVHDVEESRIGDIANPTKYHSPEVTNALNIAAFESAEIISKRLDCQDLLYYWKNQKNDTIEGRILDICDKLSVLMKIYEEVIIYHNYALIKHARSIVLRFNDLYVKEADPILSEILGEAIQICEDVLRRDV